MLMERQRTFLRDSGGGFISDDDLVAWTNEAQTDIAARTQVLHDSVTGTTSGTIPLPTDPALIEIIELLLGTDRVAFVDSVTFNSFTDQGIAPGTTIARVFETDIELYPTPSASVYVLRFSKIPNPLVNGSDEHELPPQFERKLIEYPVAQGKYKDGATDEGDRWLARYEQGLPGVSIGREKYFTGPLFVTRESNIWDRQRGASHV